MSQLTVSDSFVQAVKGATIPIELLNDRGEVVGTFVPRAEVSYERFIPEITPEERARLKNSSSVLSTDELLKRLGFR